MINKIKSILDNYTGNESVYLFAEDSRKLYKWNEVNVNLNEKVLEDLESILSKDSIKIRN